MRVGSGVQALLNEATVLFPISRTAEKGHGEGARSRQSAPRDKQGWRRLQDGCGTPEQHRLGAAASHGTVTLLRWPGQLHGSWTGPLGQEPVLCCLGLHR